MPHPSSIVLLLSSLLIGILGLSLCLTKSSANDHGHNDRGRFFRIGFSVLWCVTAAILLGLSLEESFSSYALDKMDTSKSDVIPLVMVMVERFIAGDFPYADVSLWGYTLRPTYMPMIWIPFSLAEVFSFDYRWVPYGILVISIFILQISLITRARSHLLFVILSILPWALWYLFVREDTNLFSVTIENINTGYYLLFCLCLFSRKPSLVGLGLALCLLARYSFALWVPFLGLIYLIKDYKECATIVGISLAAVVMIYILPFLRQDPHMFFDSLASYTVAAVGEWDPVWQQEGEKPYHLFRGIGVAGLFYDNVEGDLLTRIKTLQLWHYLTSILVLIPMFIFYFRKRKHLHLGIFLIASLKIYFVFFYSFIQVPYSYLTQVPVFISLFLVIYAWIHSKGRGTI